jgi:hypothetical protein
MSDRSDSLETKGEAFKRSRALPSTMRLAGRTRIPLLLFCIASLFPCSAQQRFSGRVITTDSTPVYRAIVRLHASQDTTVTITALTDTAGRFSFDLTGAEPPEGVPARFLLRSNYPNPFSGVTVIPFEIRESAAAELDIVDLLGRRVRTLASGEFEPGSYSLTWDGRTDLGESAGTGVYFAVLRCGGRFTTAKLLMTPDQRRSAAYDLNATHETSTSTPLAKTAPSRSVSVDVIDTTVALPRFVSRMNLKHSFVSDTSVIVVVDYGGWEDIGFPKQPYKLFMDDPYLYVCAQRNGLWRRNVESMTPWEYLGLADTTLTGTQSRGVVDVDARGEDILVAYEGRKDSIPNDSIVAVWKSTNSGASWIRADAGIRETINPKDDVNITTDIKRSPHDKNIAVALIEDIARYITSDNGVSWKLQNGMRGGFYVSADLWWNPYSRGEFWIAYQNAIMEVRFQGFIDFGKTGLANLNDAYPSCMAFSRSDSNVIYFSSYDIYRSTNRGAMWDKYFRINDGSIYAIIEHPQLPGYLIVTCKAAKLDADRIAIIKQGSFIVNTVTILPGRIFAKIVTDKYGRALYCICRGGIIRVYYGG